MSSRTTWKASRLLWMSAMMANFMYALALADYFKPAKLVGGFGPADVFVADEALQAGLPDGLAKCFQLVRRPFGHQLDAAIGKVADRASSLEAAGDGFDRVAEPDALHVA